MWRCCYKYFVILIYQRRPVTRCRSAVAQQGLPCKWPQKGGKVSALVEPLRVEVGSLRVHLSLFVVVVRVVFVVVVEVVVGNLDVDLVLLKVGVGNPRRRQLNCKRTG